MKIYVAAVEALWEKEKGGRKRTQFTTKIDGFFEFHTPQPPPLPPLEW